MHKPSPRAMWLHRLYRKLHHNLEKILADPHMGQWWAEMSNEDRTYVLIGGKRNG